MLTNSPKLLLRVTLFNITSHFGHLTPSSGPVACDGRVTVRRNRALTMMTTNRRLGRTASSQTGAEVSSGEEPGKVITRASCPRRPGELPVASKALAGD